MYPSNNAHHSKHKENGNYNYCLFRLFCFYFQNCSSVPLIKKFLKVDCKVEACRTCRILQNVGGTKCKAGIST